MAKYTRHKSKKRGDDKAVDRPSIAKRLRQSPKSPPRQLLGISNELNRSIELHDSDQKNLVNALLRESDQVHN